MQIAGKNTEKEWVLIRDQLKAAPTTALWTEAYTGFHLKRIESRYMNPIQLLGQEMDREGEGFSMVALFCTLIEFFATTESGKNFKLDHQDRGNHQYGLREGKTFFTSFLDKHTEFYPIVPLGSSEEFYSDVRCGLLHEARTCNGWTIVAHTALATGPKPIYRDRLLPVLREYLENYRASLLTAADALPHTPTQAAFIRKWDHLATP
jgi:hypothetical protein